MEGSGMFPPHHVPADSPFVQTLLQCYTDVTGKPGKPFAIGGGTYVHHLKNGVAFGCADLEVDNRMHGADEFRGNRMPERMRCDLRGGDSADLRGINN